VSIAQRSRPVCAAGTLIAPFGHREVGQVLAFIEGIPAMPTSSSDQPTQGGTEPTTPAPRLNPGDEAAPGTPGTGEDVCPRCGGTGQLQGRPCDECGGTGKVTVGVGGA
jgi:hypothetical protein